MKKSLLMILLLVILVVGCYKNVSPNVSQTSDPNIKVITIDASKFKYDPGTIDLKKGDHVKIIINNKDETHGIVIPDFNVSGIDSVEFIADKVGTFEFHCPNPCGRGHDSMKGIIVVSE